MNKGLKTFIFMFGIAIGFSLLFIGISLMVNGLFGEVFSWKEIIVGLSLDVIGLFILFLNANISQKGEERE